MSMATRIAVMSQGRIAQLGTPQEVYETPANRFVADFIGAVNLLAGRVTQSAEGIVHIDCGEIGGSVNVESPQLPVGREVTVALRPEKVTLRAAATSGEVFGIAGEVRSVAYRGEASTYEIALATGKIMRATLSNTERRAAPFAVGQSVALSWEPAACVVLAS